MITESLDVMSSLDGIYIVHGVTGILFVEVESGKVYQLNPKDFNRDGELSKGGWNLDFILNIIGPLQRKS